MLAAAVEQQKVGVPQRINMHRNELYRGLGLAPVVRLFVLSIVLIYFVRDADGANAQQYILCKLSTTHECLVWEIQMYESVDRARKLYLSFGFGETCFRSDQENLTEDDKFVTVRPLIQDWVEKRVFCSTLTIMPTSVFDLSALMRSVPLRNRRDVGHSSRGRYRGQTQSQYLAIDRGNGKDEGKAEAHSAADSSRATVTGSSGMGQAQSQSMFDPSCDDCVGGRHEIDSPANLRHPGGSSTQTSGVPGVGYGYGNTPGGGYGNGNTPGVGYGNGNAPGGGYGNGNAPGGGHGNGKAPRGGYGNGIAPGGGFGNGNSPGGGYGNGDAPGGGYSNGIGPGGGYGNGKAPEGGYGNGGAPGGGYGNANAPGGGYVNGKAPGGGYGNGEAPGDGYGNGNAPSGGYGNGDAPGGGYENGNAPSGGYGNGKPPGGGYGNGNTPGVGYGNGIAPGGGYGNVPSGVYGNGNAPGGGYGSGKAPGGGYGNGNAPGGGYGNGKAPGSGYINGNTPGGNYGNTPGGNHNGNAHNPGSGYGNGITQPGTGYSGGISPGSNSYGNGNGNVPDGSEPGGNNYNGGSIPGGGGFVIGNRPEGGNYGGKNVPGGNGYNNAALPEGGYQNGNIPAGGGGPYQNGYNVNFPNNAGGTNGDGRIPRPQVIGGSTYEVPGGIGSTRGTQGLPSDGSGSPGTTYPGVISGALKPELSGYIPGSSQGVTPDAVLGSNGGLRPNGLWPLGPSFTAPDGRTFYCCTAGPNTALPGAFPGGDVNGQGAGVNYYPGKGQGIGGIYTPGVTGTGAYVPGAVYGPVTGVGKSPIGNDVGINPQGLGGSYRPDRPGTDSIGPYATGGGTAPEGPYGPGGIGSDGFYRPGESDIGPSGGYGNGPQAGPDSIAIGEINGGTGPKPSGGGGTYGPGRDTANNFVRPYRPGGTGTGPAGPGGSYEIVGPQGIIPGGPYGHGGPHGTGTGLRETYGPGGGAVPGGIYGPDVGSGTNYGPGDYFGPNGSNRPGGSYGPKGVFGPGSGYVPIESTQQNPKNIYGSDSQGARPNSYGPGSTSGGSYVPGGKEFLMPGSETGNGNIGPGGVGQESGGPYGPGGSYVPGGSVGIYKPGDGIGGSIGGSYGPSGGGSRPLGPGVTYNPSGTYDPEGLGPNGQGSLGSIGPGGNAGQDGQNGIPQNFMDPNSIADGDDSQAEASVSQATNGTIASASARGGNDKGRAQTNVHGTYTGSGSFAAQAEITGENKAANSEVSGDKKGASSSAQGSGRNNKSQANVKLGSETGSVITGSQSEGVLHSSNTQVQGSVKGGMADAQARGPGSTSSQAQIGFTPYKDSDKPRHDLQKTPFMGGGVASAQSSGRTGKSQSQLRGTFKYGITYNGASQAGASLDKDAVFPDRLPFDKIDVFDENDTNINNDVETEKPTESAQQSELVPSTELPFEGEYPIDTSIKTETEPIDHSESEVDSHSHKDHHTVDGTQEAPTRLPPVEDKRSFQPTYSPNSGDYEYSTDKEYSPDDYDVDDGFGTEEGEVTDTNQNYANSNYNEFSKKTEDTHQSLHNPKRKGVDVRQTTGGNTQHIILGSLGDQDAEITQTNSERPDESKVYQPGERVPGTGGYTIPTGFTGSVKSVASREKTYVVGSKDSPSQAQTVSLRPGTGKVRYRYSPYVKNVDAKNLRSLYNSKPDDNRYVSVSKSVTRDLDSENNIRKQYSHTYYTKSSSCGYFTFTCTIVSSAEGKKKVCKPKLPTNPDGTPMRC